MLYDITGLAVFYWLFVLDWLLFAVSFAEGAWNDEVAAFWFDDWAKVGLVTELRFAVGGWAGAFNV